MYLICTYTKDDKTKVYRVVILSALWILETIALNVNIAAAEFDIMLLLVPMTEVLLSIALNPAEMAASSLRLAVASSFAALRCLPLFFFDDAIASRVTHTIILPTLFGLGRPP